MAINWHQKVACSDQTYLLYSPFHNSFPINEAVFKSVSGYV
jgi:hypothetical protein